MKKKPQEPVKRKRGGQPGHPHYRPPGSNGAPKGHPPYPGCETGGRPPIWTDEKIEEIADLLIQFMDDPDNIYFKKFINWLKRAKNISIPIEYLSRWSEKNEKFLDAYNYAKIEQETRIVEGCLTKKLDSGMGRFMLAAVHGLSEKQVIEHQGQDIINIVHYGKKPPKTWKEESEIEGK